MESHTVPSNRLPKNTPPPRETGYAIVLDIVDFSTLPELAQFEAIHHLSKCTMEMNVLRGRNHGRDFVLNGTGDGVLIALRAAGGASPIEILDGVVELVVSMPSFRSYSAAWPNGRHLEVRAGLHVGSFFCGLELFGLKKQIAGNGLNWCTRIADLAGTRQVAVSQQFVDQILQIAGHDGLPVRFIPPIADAPAQSAVKHEKIASYRLVDDGRLGRTLSGKVARVQRASDELAEQMRRLGRWMFKHLTHEMPDAPKPRVSLWIAANDRSHLWCSPLRFQGDSYAPVIAGHQYKMPSDGQVLGGPIGMCAAERKPQIALDFPDYDRDEDAYLRRWEQLGVSREQVGKFSRKSRSIVTVPLTYGGDCIGVLCFDWVPLLTNVTPDWFAERLQFLEAGQAQLIAALWMLQRIG